MRKWKIEIEAQEFIRDSFDGASAKVRELMSKGVWFMHLTKFEDAPVPVPPAVKPKPRSRRT